MQTRRGFLGMIASVGAGVVAATRLGGRTPKRVNVSNYPLHTSSVIRPDTVPHELLTEHRLQQLRELSQLHSQRLDALLNIKTKETPYGVFRWIEHKGR